MLLSDALKEPSKVVEMLQSGGTIIYPTDTIYGIGCSAHNAKAVEKIRFLKKRESKPFSIWAPSVEWVRKNCDVEEKYLHMLPGPVTLIVKLKNAVANNVCDDTIGVRIPDHPFHTVVHQLGVPIVTTSVNVSGEKHVTNTEQIPTRFKQVDLIINAGTICNPPSKIVNTITGEILCRQ
jgi:tRNA threonylcarbamoyl adenosine modification protein (Sua5/YciO/YrdC/YwlC family)